MKDQEIEQAAKAKYGNDPNEYGAQRDGFKAGTHWALEQIKKEDELPEGFKPYQYQTDLYSGVYDVIDADGKIQECWYSDIDNQFECDGYIVGFKKLS